MKRNGLIGFLFICLVMTHVSWLADGYALGSRNKPPVVNLTADRLNIVLGESVTLTWTSSYADYCDIEPDITQNSNCSGSEQIYPTRTTTYTFTASNDDGESSTALTITVTVPDSDNDGVIDDLDICPNTPTGESVDENGCSESQKDSDRDDVTNDKDLCPDTPADESVDESGCSESQKDSDRDDVTNDKDLCPDTPAGEIVDQDGCSDSQKNPETYIEQKLIASDGAAYDEFGWSVSISGNVALVGAYYDDDNGSNSGSVYVYKWNGSAWVEQQKLLASDGAADDTFGRSVSISGDVALVGATGSNGNSNDSGSAYVYCWDGSTWVEQQKLLASDGADGDEFVWSVSISGDVALVGARLDDYCGRDSGSAYVFRWNGNAWVEEQKLWTPDGSADDEFGTSVSLSGEFALVGAYRNNDCGSAYVFRWNGSTWLEEQKLLASDHATNDFFGRSVSISGDVALVGADGNDDNGIITGSAYVFRWNGSTWVEAQKLLASDGYSGDQFGISVSINGDVALVGTYLDDDNGWDSGSAYVYRWNGSNWEEVQKLLASDGADSDMFGRAVSIFGDVALVGSSYDGDSNTGSAYVYTLQQPETDM